MKRTLTGTVIKKSGDKTVAVLVVRKRQHPTYHKTVSTSKKYLVHDPKNAAVVGGVVTIQESRPISKRKSWTVVYNTSPRSPLLGKARGPQDEI